MGHALAGMVRGDSGGKKGIAPAGQRVDQLYAAREKSSDDREFPFSVNTYQTKLHLFIAECALSGVARRRSLASDYPVARPMSSPAARPRRPTPRGANTSIAVCGRFFSTSSAGTAKKTPGATGKKQSIPRVDKAWRRISWSFMLPG